MASTTYTLPDLPWAVLLGPIVHDARPGDIVVVHTDAMRAHVELVVRAAGRNRPTAIGMYPDRRMLTVGPQPVPLTTTADGSIRVTGTRVPLETIVRAFHQGASTEEIVQDFSTLTLAQVYAARAESWTWRHCT